MVHGAYEGWWVYRKWLTFFATNGWTSHAMSLRNHAGSYRIPDEEYVETGVADYVDDVRAVLAWIGRPAVVLGHSLGGLVAQKVAETEPVKALVLLASVGPGQLGPHAPDFPLGRPVDSVADTRAEAPDTTLDPDSFERFVDALQPESPRALNEARGRTPVDRERITCPALVVGAGADQYPMHATDRIAAFYGCESVMLPNARHGVMIEADALTAAIRINEWLSATPNL
jgi:pimeloyl-ACP methyl ester carboxylesterase